MNNYTESNWDDEDENRYELIETAVNTFTFMRSDGTRKSVQAQVRWLEGGLPIAYGPLAGATQLEWFRHLFTSTQGRWIFKWYPSLEPILLHPTYPKTEEELLAKFAEFYMGKTFRQIDE